MDKKEEIRQQIQKWREERKQRLISRLFRNQPMASSTMASAILGIRPTEPINTSHHKHYPQQPKSRYRQSIAPPSMAKSREENMKRHTLNPRLDAQTLHGIGKAIQKSSLQRKSKTIGKESRISVMKKYDENRKSVIRKTLAAIENTEKPVIPKVTFAAKVEEACEKIDSVANATKEIIDDCQNSEDKIDTGDDLNSTFTLPSPDGEPLSPIGNTRNSGSAFNRRNSSTPLKASTPEDKDLSDRLSTWLKSKGKSLDKFPHLKCFCRNKFSSPSRQPMKEINSNSKRPAAVKPRPSNLPAIVIETIHEEQENSCGDLTFALTSKEPQDSQPVSPKPKDVSSPNSEPAVELNGENLNEMTVKALHELLTLIHSGYPWESCKDWLVALRRRNPDTESLPDYWECLAALEEVQGDMQMAVDSYQRALMRGAEISHIDDCLDSLFEKMSSLNLECQPYTPRQTKKANQVDAKNIFKSTVIQFALMQQKVKKFSSEVGVSANNLNYIATPVRRSTRMSLFSTKTPQRCVTSIKNLISDENEHVQFKPNKALLFDD